MTGQEAEALIHQRAWTGRTPGLERIRRLLGKLGDPQKSLRFVHIAGSNGKGSTAAMLSSILTAAGLRTGLYTSPHLWSFGMSSLHTVPLVLRHADEFLGLIAGFFSPALNHNAGIHLIMENSPDSGFTP